MEMEETTNGAEVLSEGNFDDCVEFHFERTEKCTGVNFHLTNLAIVLTN